MLTKLKPFNWLLPLLFIPILAYCSTLIQLRQIAAPNAVSLIGSDGNTLGPVTVGAGLSLNGGSLTATGALPAIVDITATASTANSFPIPAGKSVCIVARNGLTMAQGVDFSVASGVITFLSNPSIQAGEQIQLACW